jgi:hypothetical protein
VFPLLFAIRVVPPSLRRSEAIIVPHEKYGLLRRFVPLHKRFAFVAGNDGVATA